MPLWHWGGHRMSGGRLCGVCNAPLSRYNPDGVCASCARQIATAPAVPLWLWDSEPLRQALAEINLGKALTIIRTAIGLTQLQLASLLSWNQSTVARAEAGQRDTLYDIRCFLEVADALDMPREALIPLVLGTTDSTQIEREGNADVNLNRRQFSNVIAGLAAATAALGNVRVPDLVDSAHMRYLNASVAKLYAKDQKIGGGTLARDGLRQYQRARRMLDEADYSESTGNQLMSTAGELAVCVGWLSYDSSDHTTARELYSDALLLAEQSGNDGLAIRAMEKMVLQSVQLARTTGRPGSAREAVRFGARAAELARRDPSPRLHALLAAREAIAYAAAGDRHGCEAAMARAWREVDHGLDGDEPPAWLRFVNSSEIAVHEAKSRSYLGDSAAASRLYRLSLESTLSPRNAANYRAQLASALVTGGDLTAALEEGMIVLLALEDKIVSPRTVAELRPLRSAVTSERRGEEFKVRFDQATASPHVGTT